jgi:hypothetical protein
MIHYLNGSLSDRIWAIILMALNIITAVITGAAGISAAVNPATVAPGVEVGSGAVYFAQLYAARAIPLAVAVIVIFVTRREKWVAPILLVSGVVQLADVAIAIGHSNVGLLAGAAVSAIVHLGSAAWFLRREQSTAD